MPQKLLRINLKRIEGRNLQVRPEEDQDAFTDSQGSCATALKNSSRAAKKTTVSIKDGTDTKGFIRVIREIRGLFLLISSLEMRAASQ
jgi:hypothetical protein